ncbi:hypothetical protein [Micromonospora inositola]|uniref:Uncharacterized protein n=1 Tax=Micromonospora inositola TaxID=47865 RepID=A0A1C5GR95_9ACTN|nr:hypothetical protein [Micromonospora inositola]SCG36315.1 hypothetical protein GA0070613_0273 [Micromonospora inositola]
MTDDEPTSAPPRRLDNLFAADPEPIRIPDWMRQPATDHELTRAERLRLGWEKHSGKLLGAVGLLLVVGFLGFLGTAGYRFVDKVNHGEVVLPVRSRATTAPRPVDADGNTLGVFVGTPAERFAECEAGITLPAARPSGPFTAKQVADGLAAVRAALVEGRLEPGMLHFDDQDRFLARLAPDARTAVRADLAKGASLGYATRIARDANPAWVPEDGIRVRGTIEYAATTDRDGIRVLSITTRFFWVYSFDLFQAQTYPPGAELITLRDQVVWQLPHPDDVRPSSRGLWIADADVTILNSTCAALDKGFIALEAEPALLRRLKPQPTGDVYDDSWRPGDGEEC